MFHTKKQNFRTHKHWNILMANLSFGLVGLFLFLPGCGWHCDIRPFLIFFFFLLFISRCWIFFLVLFSATPKNICDLFDVRAHCMVSSNSLYKYIFMFGNDQPYCPPRCWMMVIPCVFDTVFAIQLALCYLCSSLIVLRCRVYCCSAFVLCCVCFRDFFFFGSGEFLILPVP